MSALFPGAIETDRLRLERFCHDNVDVLSYYDVVSADEMAEVARYMPWDPHGTPKESEAFVDDAEKQWNEGEAAEYAIRPRGEEPRAGEFAGQAGLSVEWDRRRGELGTWLRRPFWGRGYSGERAMALLALAFDRLDLEVVAVTHHEDNENSRRAVEKYVERFGGQRDGVLRNWIPYGDEVADEVLYTVTREGWDANHPGEDAVTFGDG